MEEFIVGRKAIHEHVVAKAQVPELKTNSVIIKIEKFSFTMNTVTYAAAGETLKYFYFFPNSWDNSFVKIPSWGVGTVVKSNISSVAVGTRWYGFYPMSQYIHMTPVKVTSNFFVDGTNHRAGLPDVYNQYTLMPNLPNKDLEDLMISIRPLFFTSYLIADLLVSTNFFGAQVVLISSASSKTSIGLAFQLRQSKKVKVIGLTSPANEKFVQSLDLYDQVVCYDSVSSLASLEGSPNQMLVDIAGSASLRQSLRNHLQARLVYTLLVGVTHWQSIANSANTAAPAPSGPNTTFFFAPAQIKKLSEEQGGFAAVQDTITRAMIAFVQHTSRWAVLRRGFGSGAVGYAYDDMLSGHVHPTVFVMLSMWPKSLVDRTASAL
eukprot:c11204_g1_i1.p1 GENE.c11204_g1_i1~~c11204_g1_i1.p1  ORF type:complete len:390 (-),score=91.54 c11204_g1_i1:300-1433(-)